MSFQSGASRSFLLFSSPIRRIALSNFLFKHNSRKIRNFFINRYTFGPCANFKLEKKLIKY